MEVFRITETPFNEEDIGSGLPSVIGGLKYTLHDLGD